MPNSNPTDKDDENPNIEMGKGDFSNSEGLREKLKSIKLRKNNLHLCVVVVMVIGEN